MENTQQKVFRLGTLAYEMESNFLRFKQSEQLNLPRISCMQSVVPEREIVCN